MAPDSPPHLDVQLALQQRSPTVPYLLDEIELLHLHNRMLPFGLLVLFPCYWLQLWLNRLLLQVSHPNLDVQSFIRSA